MLHHYYYYYSRKRLLHLITKKPERKTQALNVLQIKGYSKEPK